MNKGDTMDVYKRLADMIVSANGVYVLTGAGMSTDSGIPDFRSEGTGLWEKVDPIEALSTTVLYDNPEKFYSLGFKMLLEMRDKEPNQGHKILAEMEEKKYIRGIITQNIDNLHSAAGSKNVLEVHGNTRDFYCDSCGLKYDYDYVIERVNKGEVPPLCQSCGGIVRPDVVMFGDAMPEEFQMAYEEIESSELLIVIGSSLTVSPVNYLPTTAKRLVIINLTETPLDSRAELVINENSTEVLRTVWEYING